MNRNIRRLYSNLQKDREELPAFYDFPAQYWHRIRTSNPIESTFGTIRHRTKHCKGCLSRDGMLRMMFKLGQCAEKNWGRLRGFDYLAKVVTGIKFKNEVQVTVVDKAAACFKTANTRIDNNSKEALNNSSMNYSEYEMDIMRYHPFLHFQWLISHHHEI